MKIRFCWWADFDPELQRLFEETARERGHIVGDSRETALITLIDGSDKPVRKLKQIVQMGRRSGGFIAVVNPASVAIQYADLCSAWVLNLQSKDEEGLRVEISEWFENIEGCMATIT